jgi:hypothetical protein
MCQKLVIFVANCAYIKIDTALRSHKTFFGQVFLLFSLVRSLQNTNRENILS